MRLASLVSCIAMNTLACSNILVSEQQSSARAAPHASQQAEIIVDRYRNDPRLGDDLFNDKIVEIVAYRVDEIDGEALIMKDRGFVLRLEDIVPGKIKKGDVITLVCEGDGMEGETTIVFEGCKAP